MVHSPLILDPTPVLSDFKGKLIGQLVAVEVQAGEVRQGSEFRGDISR